MKRPIDQLVNPLGHLAARPQESFVLSPYDRWLTPGGEVSAEFYRSVDGFTVRFPAQADFKIDPTGHNVLCVPTPGTHQDVIADIHSNSILPLIGNHNGELNLHGSATAVVSQAIGFVGLSGRGKTTLVGAFARAGCAFLSEDVLSLKSAEGHYWVQPKRPVLRLFADSAEFLLRGNKHAPVVGHKMALHARPTMPHQSSGLPLSSIYLLGPGAAYSVTIERLGKADALANIMQHAFILDVDDRVRLSSHFERVSGLVESVPCYFLDFPRNYNSLADVIDQIIGQNK